MALEDTPQNRLSRLVTEAELTHEMAIYNGGGSGNREYESTQGAIDALTKAQETLRAKEDPTREKVKAQVVRNITKALGFIKIKGFEWLHIGDESEIAESANGDYEIILRMEGTRIDLMRAFLESKKPKDPQ